MFPLFMEPGEFKKKKKKRGGTYTNLTIIFIILLPFFPTLAMVAIAPLFKHAQWWLQTQ